MSEKLDLNLTTKEEVAFKLASDIAGRETLYEDSSTYREKFLDLYAECLFATSGHRNFNK